MALQSVGVVTGFWKVIAVIDIGLRDRDLAAVGAAWAVTSVVSLVIKTNVKCVTPLVVA